MPLESITANDVQGRAAVQSLLPRSPDQALARARSIRHPWYRCQALASVAEVQETLAAKQRTLTESFAAAFEQSEPNRIVSVASWPLKYVVQIDSEQAERQTERLLTVAAAEPHGLRRLDALSRVLWAVASSPRLRVRVSDAYLATATACAGWRTERSVAFMAEYVASFDPALGQHMLSTRSQNRFKKRAAAAIAALLRRDDA